MTLILHGHTDTFVSIPSILKEHLACKQQYLDVMKVKTEDTLLLNFLSFFVSVLVLGQTHANRRPLSYSYPSPTCSIHCWVFQVSPPLINSNGIFALKANIAQFLLKRLIANDRLISSLKWRFVWINALFYISAKILPPPETVADQADAAKGICK